MTATGQGLVEVGSRQRPTPEVAQYLVRAGRFATAVALSAIAVLLPPAVYLWFVVRNSVDGIWQDSWNGVVPLIDAALHHSLTVSMLWTQHNENRMIVANSIFVLFGRYDHYDTRSIVLLSGALYIIGFWLLLYLWRPPLHRFSGAAATVLVGAVWFSFEDWENALWAFQLAWFLVALLLLVMLTFLARFTIRPWHLAAAGVAAALASFCSLQGLILWPIGLLCLLWRLGTLRRRVWYGGVWICAGAAAIALYFWGLDLAGDNGVSVAVRHPLVAIKFFFAAIGNLYPVHGRFAATEVIGAVIFLVAAWVCVREFRRRADRCLPLAVALIGYGVCFDITITIGRVELGLPQALASRYTLSNLFVIVGIAVHFLSPRALAHLRRQSLLASLLVLPLVVALAGQVAVADHYGWESGKTQLRMRQISAWVEVNLTRLPASQQHTLFSEYAFGPGLTPVLQNLRQARTDHLSVFYPPVYRYYRNLKGP